MSEYETRAFWSMAADCGTPTGIYIIEALFNSSPKAFIDKPLKLIISRDIYAELNLHLEKLENRQKYAAFPKHILIKEDLFRFNTAKLEIDEDPFLIARRTNALINDKRIGSVSQIEVPIQDIGEYELLLTLRLK